MITLNKEAPQSKFTLIKNAFHTDYDLSDGAFRLLFHLMSLPNDWEINWEQIAKTLKISLATLKRRKKELIDKNILQRQREVVQNKLTNHQQYFINNQAEVEEVEKVEDISKAKTNEVLIHSKNEKLKNEKLKNDRVKNETPYNNNTNAESTNTKKYYLGEYFDIKKLFALNIPSLKEQKDFKYQKKLENLDEYFNDEEIPLVSEWVAHKRRFKVSQKRILDELLRAKKAGNLIQSINYSLNNGYRGLFPPKESFKTNAQNARISRERIMEIWES